MAALARFFSPRSIAVIGASADAAKIGAKALLALEVNGYRGEIYPVNPKSDLIGDRRCYPSVQSISAPVDLAIISVPAPLVPAALRDCAAKDVGYAVIFSAGFAEAGADGLKLQAEITQIVRGSNVRVLGPNTAGAVFHGNGMAASFASIFTRPPSLQKSGGAAFITQSGAFGVYVYNLAGQIGLGFDYYVNTGNEVDLEVSDFLNYLADQPDVRVVALYLEGVRDGAKFRKAAEKCFRRGLPVVAVKVGRSDAASRAALSHTGAMTGSDEVYDAVFRQCGVIRVDGISELLDLASLFGHKVVPRGKRVGILTTTGGGGVWMVDKCREVGLEVPEFVGSTRRDLESVLPAFAAASNPADLTGQFYTDRQLFRNCVNIVTRDSGIDALILLSGGDPEMIGAGVPETIVEAARGSDIPLLVAWVGAPEQFYSQLIAAGVPAFADLARCARALGSAAGHGALMKKFESRSSPVAVAASGENESLRAAVQNAIATSDRLPEHAAKELLRLAGIAISETRLAENPEHAVKLAQQFGYPVVVKAESRDLMHRSEIGAVALNLGSKDDVISAYHRVLDRARQHVPDTQDVRVSVQPMLPRGVELIAGLTRDPVFGTILLVGLGGIQAEALKDSAIRAVPIDVNQAREMLIGLRGSTLLTGFRGSPPADVDAAVHALTRLSDLAQVLGEALVELDINPLVVFEMGKGVAAADALMVVRGQAKND